MIKNTQKTLILQRLKETGSVSRNWCLKNYISRLGAIIQQLESEGYQFSAEYVKDKQSGYKDYVYTLMLTPEEDKELTQQKRVEEAEQRDRNYYFNDVM
jgi:ribosomal protein S8